MIKTVNISKGFLQEKINFKRPSPGKNNSQKALSQKKINPFSIFAPAPRSFMVDLLPYQQVT